MCTLISNNFNEIVNGLLKLFDIVYTYTATDGATDGFILCILIHIINTINQEVRRVGKSLQRC